MAAALDSTPMRLLGLATGLVFGAMLHKGRVNRRKVIRGQLLFRDARSRTITEGSSEMQRIIIASEMLSRRSSVNRIETIG